MGDVDELEPVAFRERLRFGALARGDLIDLLAAYTPDEAVRNRILVANPERLYDFG